MNRHTANAWTLYLEGQTSQQNLAAIDQTDLALLTQLRSDLGTDALLRATARAFDQSDEDQFVHALQAAISVRNADERFVQAVTSRIVRRRFARRAGSVAAMAILFMALVAAAAWFLGQSGIERDNAKNVPRIHNAPTATSTQAETPQLAAKTPIVARKQQRMSLVILGHLPATASDELIVKRLRALGFQTALKIPSALDLTRDLHVDLIVISSTVESEDMAGPISATLSTTPVPLVVWEPWLFDDLGLADCPHNNGCGWLVAGDGLDVVNHGEPLMHAESSKIEATDAPTVVSFGVPKPSAKVVATVQSVVPLQVLFVYERGAALSFGPAPARRAALFLSDDTARKLTNDGWAMFDLAIEWASAAK